MSPDFTDGPALWAAYSSTDGPAFWATNSAAIESTNLSPNVHAVDSNWAPFKAAHIAAHCAAD